MEQGSWGAGFSLLGWWVSLKEVGLLEMGQTQEVPEFFKVTGWKGSNCGC